MSGAQCVPGERTECIADNHIYLVAKLRANQVDLACPVRRSAYGCVCVLQAKSDWFLTSGTTETALVHMNE